MALKLFCNKCGLPTLYTTLLPNRCSNCGNNFNFAFSPSPSQAQSATPLRKIEAVVIDEQPEEYKDEDGYYTPVLEVPQLDSLEVEIDLSTNHQKSLGSFLPKQPISTKGKKRGPKPKNRK